MCRTWSETQIVGLLKHRLIFILIKRSSVDNTCGTTVCWFYDPKLSVVPLFIGFMTLNYLYSNSASYAIGVDFRGSGLHVIRVIESPTCFLMHRHVSVII